MRIVVADPVPLLRGILVGAFEGQPDIDVVASAASLTELRAHCETFDPQVVLAATAFPDGALVSALVDILVRGTRVLLVCGADDARTVTTLLFAGASGCLFWQDCGAADLVVAVRDVGAGHAALHPAAAAAVLEQWRAVRHRDVVPDVPARPAEQTMLTPREAEVLEALARGLPTKSIGRELGISPKTVEAHVARLLTKLGARNRAQAVAQAQSNGLLATARA